MNSSDLESIVAARRGHVLGQAQAIGRTDVERVNTPAEKAVILARLTLQLAALDYERNAK